MLSSTDDGEDFLPGDIDVSSLKSRSIPHNLASTPTSSPLVRGRKTDTSLYHMSTILASVAMGFDIGIANTRAIHPHLHSPDVDDDRSVRKRDSYINNRRDAYLAAVRDAFIEPEGDFRSYQAPPQGYWHTYHGPQNRHRPSIPMGTEPFNVTATSASNDTEVLPLTTAALGMPEYGYYNARTTSHRSSFAESEASSTSATTPLTERTVIYNRQQSTESGLDVPPKSDGAGAVTGNGGSVTTAKLPQRRSVTFEDDFIAQDYNKYSSSNTFSSHRRTPSNTSNSSNPIIDQDSSRYDYYRSPSHSSDHNNPSNFSSQQRLNLRRHQGSDPPQRPTTLDVGPVPTRPLPIQLKYPATSGAAVAPQPQSIVRGSNIGHPDLIGDEMAVSQQSTTSRSHLSPGNTPPHITHHKTLLDIDVEGQNQDATRPLVQNADGKTFL